MKNGVKISRKTAHGYDVVFIPEEIIQINQLNRRIERNIAARKKAAADEQARIAELNRREQSHRQRIQKTLRGCVTLMAVASAAWLAVPMELATPILAAVVSVPCLGGVCYKLGTIK